MRLVHAVVVWREAQTGQTAELRFSGWVDEESGRSQSEPQRSQYLSSRRVAVAWGVSGVLSGANVPPFECKKEKALHECSSQFASSQFAVGEERNAERDSHSCRARFGCDDLRWGYLVLCVTPPYRSKGASDKGGAARYD